MRDFFRGWKRKLGCVTLVVACAFTAGWIRSIVVHDVLIFLVEGQASGLLGSQSGSLRWSNNGETEDQRWGRPMWQTWPASEGIHPFDDPNIKWRWRFCGFATSDDGRERIVPYWSIVIPLTLLSAWLLLSKPRSGTPATQQPLAEIDQERRRYIISSRGGKVMVRDAVTHEHIVWFDSEKSTHVAADMDDVVAECRPYMEGQIESIEHDFNVVRITCRLHKNDSPISPANES